MRNLKKWQRRSQFQGTNTDTDAENKSTDTQGEGEGGMDWEMGIDTNTLLILCIKQITNETL